MRIAFEAGRHESKMPKTVERAIFVANFAVGTNRDDIQKLFERYGVVSRLDMKDRFCFLFMPDEEAGRDAVACLHDTSHLTDPARGKNLVVEWARNWNAVKRREAARQRSSTVAHDTLFVTNFNPETTLSCHLQDLFGEYGRILRLDMQDRFAFVHFETVPAALSALKALDGVMLEERRLTVEYSTHQSVSCRNTGKRRRSRSPVRDRIPDEQIPKWMRRGEEEWRDRGRFSHDARGRDYSFQKQENRFNDRYRDKDVNETVRGRHSRSDEQDRPHYFRVGSNWDGKRPASTFSPSRHNAGEAASRSRDKSLSLSTDVAAPESASPTNQKNLNRQSVSLPRSARAHGSTKKSPQGSNEIDPKAGASQDTNDRTPHDSALLELQLDESALHSNQKTKSSELAKHSSGNPAVITSTKHADG